MSWLNFNESLNTIKGQLTNLASGVLAEGIVGNSENDTRKDFEINDCNVRQNTTHNENHWSWEASNESTSKRDTLVQDLRNKVDLLENEKKELVHSLEQLDVDHQQTTAELVALRDTLQKRHDELSTDFERLKGEYGEVLTENMEKTKQIELIRNGEVAAGDLDCLKLQELKAECQTIRESCRKAENDKDELLAKLSDATRISRETSRRTWEKFKGEKDAIQSTLAKVKEDFLSLADDLRGISEVQRSLQRFQRRQNGEDSKRHDKYLGIITECLEKYTTVDPASALSSVITGEDPQIVEFANEVENLLKLLIDFKSKTEALEEEICEITKEKSKVVNEKNFEIEKLLQNSEILSQEVIAKTQALKDYETECNELMKNNDLLILELENFKNSRLQTISETNEENMLLMESQLENANQKIEDMELIITDLETSKQETNEEVQTELDYIKRQLNITGQELSETKTDHQELKAHCSSLEEEKQSLKQALDKARVDYENMEYKCNEAFVVLESLREENEELRRNTGQQLEAVVSEQRDRLAALEQLAKEQANEIQSYTERLQRAKITETGAKLQIDTMGKEFQSSQDARRLLEEKLDHLRQEYTAAMEERQNHVSLLESQLAESSAARNELAQLLTQKHDENVRYHAEIERLASETEPELIVEKDREIEKLTDQNGFLREKCEVMAQNLLQEQANAQKIAGEQSSASALTKELERLRVHLVEVEEMYTQELVQAEQKNKEMQAKVNEIEAREKNSNYVYTSANIRANQQVETLQTQLQLVGNQRDELRVKISDIEDENNRHVAALTNLQLVLEQFQKEKEKDVFNETERIRRQITLERKVQDTLREENGNLRSQLDESKQGLQAAARLTDQLEKSKKHINALKEEVAKLQEKLQVRESSYKELHAQTDTKIDKSLIKNLIIGYVSSSANDQKQILKIIATVLDFSKKENEKVSLSKQQHSGWLASILSPIAATANNQQSLSAAFVRFLEDESRPKVLPNLLVSNRSEASGGSASSTPPPSQSPLILSEVVLPTFVDFARSRNSSAILKDVLKDNT